MLLSFACSRLRIVWQSPVNRLVLDASPAPFGRVESDLDEPRLLGMLEELLQSTLL